MDETSLLITSLEDQLVRGFRLCQAIQALTWEERLALASHDPAALTAYVEEKEALLDELAQTEDQRRTVVQELSQKFSLNSPDPSLAGMAVALPSEESSRIMRLREGTLALSGEIRELTAGNQVMASSGLERVAALRDALMLPNNFVDGKGNPMYDTGNDHDNPTPGIIWRSVEPGQRFPQNIDGKSTFPPLFTARIAARSAHSSGDSPTIQAAAGSPQSALNCAGPASTGDELRQVGDRLKQAQVELKSWLSQKEDASTPEAISALHNQESMYRAVLEVGKRAISAMNLFDISS